MTAGRVAAAGLLGLVLVAPLGQGGTESNVLAVLQGLTLVAVIAAARLRLPEGARLPAAVLPVGAFALWCALELLRVDYLFAGYTAVADVAMVCAVLCAAILTGPELPAAWLHGALIGGAGVQSILALVQHLSAGGRGLGTFVSPSHLAAFLALGAGVAGGRLLATRGRDLLGWTGLLLILPAQVLAVSSRGALAALVLAAVGCLAVGAAPLLGSRRGRLVLAASAVGVLVLTGLAAASVARRFADEDIYRHARLQIWPASLQAWADHPVAGVGPGMFEHLAESYNFPRDEGPVRYGRRFHHAHSQYLEVLVETGSVGLLLYLAALAAVLAGLARRFRADPRNASAAAGLLGLLILALQGIGEPLAMVPAIAVGAAAACGRGLAPRGIRGLRPASTPAAVLPMLGVTVGVLWVAVVAPWLAHRHFVRMSRAEDGVSFRRELSEALRFNPIQPYYYARAVRVILQSVPRLDPASYRLCYDYARKAGGLNPVDPDLALLRAEVSRRGFEEVFRDRASLEEALELYAVAVDLAPTDPVPAATRAAFLLDVGRDGEALHAATRALTIEPAFVRARRMQVEALRRLGRGPEADAAAAKLRDLQQALRDYTPQNPYERSIVEAEGPGAGGD